jgi:hypothetical protein
MFLSFSLVVVKMVYFISSKEKFTNLFDSHVVRNDYKFNSNIFYHLAPAQGKRRQNHFIFFISMKVLLNQFKNFHTSICFILMIFLDSKILKFSGVNGLHATYGLSKLVCRLSITLVTTFKKY